MKKPYRVIISAFIMADNEKDAMNQASDIIDDCSCLYELENPIWNDPQKLDSDYLTHSYSVEEMTIDEVNEEFEHQKKF